LGKLTNSENVICDPVGRFDRIDYLDEYDPVHSHLDIVFRDTNLLRYIQRLFLKTVFVGNGIEKGHDIVHSGLKGGSKLAQTLDDVGTLLRDNPYPTGDGDDDEKSYDEINELSALHTTVLLCPGLSTSFRFFLFTSYRDTAKSNRYVPFAWLSKGFAIYL
jgi:hypothetical protein